mmetsp:Transcript_64414/g.88481  ORF Transcript_64414/g.88481 Transcript_64414/m.88481 type:complete len:249 (+) Transcript_64414:35-781(+)
MERVIRPIPPRENLLVTGGNDKSIKVWDTSDSKKDIPLPKPDFEDQQGSCVRTLVGHTDCVRAARFHPDGVHMVSAGSDMTLRVWHIKNAYTVQVLDGKSAGRSAGHTGWIYDLQISPDGNQVLSAGSYDTSIKLWDLKAGHCIRTFYNKPDSWAYCLSVFGVTGEKALVGYSNKEMVLWDTNIGSKRIFKGHSKAVHQVAVSNDQTCGLSASADSTVRVWDLHAGECITTMLGHTGPVESVALSKNG